MAATTFPLFNFFLFLLISFHSSLAQQQIQLTSASGPESLAFDCKGEGPYVGVSDGRILRWDGGSHRWTDFAVSSRYWTSELCNGSENPSLESICGRPLGLAFNKETCDLYIADAYFGLLVVGSNGGLAAPLATSAEGVPFRFANGLDVDQKTGIVYFTDTSTRFSRSEFAMAILSGDKTGRLMKYDPKSKEVTLLLRGIEFANGVALSRDGSFVLVTETGTGRIIRFWLQGSKANTSDVFTQLPGQPDNIKRNSRGEIWVAVNPFEGGQRVIPYSPTLSIRQSQAMRLNEEGSVLEVFVGNGGSRVEAISEVQENDGSLWTGSVVFPYVGIYRI